MDTKRYTAETDPRTKAAVYVIEATSDERHGLWREYSEQARHGGWGSPGNPRVPWEQDNPGHLVTLGELAGRPVAMSVSYDIVDGGMLLFWEPTSRVVDYEMCEAWLHKHVPAYREQRTNTANFGHCLSYLRARRAESAR